jgi:hypothetical protein
MPELKRKDKHELFRVLPDGRYAFWFDHSMMAGYTGCETFFNYHTIQRLRLKGPARIPMSVGSWWSNVLEYYYTLRPKKTPFTLEDMIGCAGKAWVDNNMDDLERANPDRYEKFAMPMDRTDVARALGQHTADAMFEHYIKRAEVMEASLALAMSEEEAKHLEDEAKRLRSRSHVPIGPLIMASKYYINFASMDERNWRVVAAERAFGADGEVFVGEDDRVVVYYMGKPDLVVYEQDTNTLVPVDHKTKDNIPYNVDTIWKPHSQTQGYIYSVGKIAKDLGFDVVVDRCVLNVAARLEPGPKAKQQGRFRRVRVSYNQAEIAEWQDDVMWKANRLRTSLETNRWQRDHGFTCHVYAGCDYRRICSQPPSNRDLVKQSDFITVEPWNPYGEEED